MSNWLPTNTLRLARLAHPGREWTSQSDYWATARVERDLSGDVWIGFNADSLDFLAMVEKVVQDRGFGHQLRAALVEEMHRHRHLAYNWVEGVLPWATPDERRRALIAVMDASPEIEKQ